jgi:hypothetical protein
MNIDIIIVIFLAGIGITQFIGLLMAWRYMSHKEQRQRPGHLQAVGLEDITAASMKALLFNQLQWEHIQRMAKDLRNGRYDEDAPNNTSRIERLLEQIEKQMEREA